VEAAGRVVSSMSRLLGEVSFPVCCFHLNQNNPAGENVASDDIENETMVMSMGNALRYSAF